MSPSSNHFVKTFVVVVVLGYLLTLEYIDARGLEEQQADSLNYNQGNLQQQAQQENLDAAAAQMPMLSSDDSQNLDRLDSDDDDDDDDRFQQVQPDQRQQQTNGPAQFAAGSDLYQTDQSYQPPYQTATQDLKPAASKHHGHKHGAKGWLDMGAWTGKKGAFGWYDKHPVGKGKK